MLLPYYRQHKKSTHTYTDLLNVWSKWDGTPSFRSPGAMAPVALTLTRPCPWYNCDMLYLKSYYVQVELFTSYNQDFHQSLGSTKIFDPRAGPSVRCSEQFVRQNLFCIRFKVSCTYYQDWLQVLMWKWSMIFGPYNVFFRTPALQESGEALYG
jgi:hypothetical protein